MHAEFVERLTALAAKRRLGNPLSLETEQGPQVDQAQFDKIMSYIDKGQSEGAKCLTGGSRFGDVGYFVQPTVFDQVTDEMSIAKEEIFGPVMSILTFEDWDELIQRANNTMFGLAAAFGPRMSPRLMILLVVFAPVPFGSTATMCLMQRHRSAASR